MYMCIYIYIHIYTYIYIYIYIYIHINTKKHSLTNFTVDDLVDAYMIFFQGKIIERETRFLDLPFVDLWLSFHSL